MEIYLAVRLLGNLGYNEVAERIVNGDQDTESCILADFLQSTASQLTVYGLFELNAALSDGQIAVLFRNNHFHTLYKHKVCACRLFLPFFSNYGLLSSGFR